MHLPLIFDRYRARRGKWSFAVIAPDEGTAVDINNFVQKKKDAETSDLWNDLYFKVKNICIESAVKYNVEAILRNKNAKKCWRSVGSSMEGFFTSRSSL